MERMLIETASKTYPLVLGNGIRHQVYDLIPHSYSSVLIITDSHVAKLYLEDVVTSFDKQDVPVHSYVVPSGEASKSFEQFYQLQTFALDCSLDRRSLIIALGGGVIGDLAGFVAATYMRGISFVQIPTTLLAHDSSVGGKVAINHPLGKNMIGAFHQPDAVLYDLETLTSLPESELRSGFAEVVKHALIWNEDFYRFLIEHIHSFHDLLGEHFAYVLRTAIQVKAEIVQKDETEQGIRSFLNFGHTLGHAIEAELGYGGITHGEAVAIGMVYAMRVSKTFYNISLPIEEMESYFRIFGYSLSIPSACKKESLLEKMKKDKKSQKGTVKMVLMKQIGEVEVQAVSDEMLLKQMEEGGRN